MTTFPDREQETMQQGSVMKANDTTALVPCLKALDFEVKVCMLEFFEGTVTKESLKLVIDRVNSSWLTILCNFLLALWPGTSRYDLYLCSWRQVGDPISTHSQTSMNPLEVPTRRAYFSTEAFLPIVVEI